MSKAQSVKFNSGERGVEKIADLNSLILSLRSGYANDSHCAFALTGFSARSHRPDDTCVVLEVEVGVQGSFYTPPTISAGVNDTVIFVFGGDEHTVTQSTFDAPCVRLDGGFDSGFQGRGADFTLPPSVWSLIITNVSESAPPPLLRAINPPSIEVYNQFVSAAKLVTSTPKPSPSFIASGEGAFATNSPIPSSISLSADSSFSLISPTSTTTLLATSTTPVTLGGSGSHITLIAGCATAGGVVILILAVLVVFHCRRWREYRLSHSQANAMYQDKSAGLVSMDSSTAAANTFPTAVTPSATVLYRSDDMEQRSSSPSRTALSLPHAPSRNQLRQANADDRGNADPEARVDINALAVEVASMLLHPPPPPGARQHPDSSRNKSAARRRNESGWYESSNEADPRAPPHYRSS
ncbi:hypothetical protein MSAN_01102200 [Mycena sanguinolenta]|uniref:Uncharacterized protein n=1 Tax=Mycena sanguinolenta TaxID=230812 RepID=A0A8H6YTL4_9AGAR|nr:hypothetical protein MSAN_01102200 [Mycena sanguinolenta]